MLFFKSNSIHSDIINLVAYNNIWKERGSGGAYRISLSLFLSAAFLNLPFFTAPGSVENSFKAKIIRIDKRRG